MTLQEGIWSRLTTNGPFLPDPVTLEHQHRLIDAASCAPSHFNCQPWRFILVDDRSMIDEVGRVSGACMHKLLSEGSFFERYRPYFRFSEKEIMEKRDGIFIDHLPKALRPFIRQVFTPQGVKVMNALGVSKRLAADNEKLVSKSPLLLVVLLTKSEYRPGKLSGFYSMFGMGAAVENIWLLTQDLGMGIQFVSTPMEVPEEWAKLSQFFSVPEELEMMAIYRLGYLPKKDDKRPSIDWSSRFRRKISQITCRNSWGEIEKE